MDLVHDFYKSEPSFPHPTYVLLCKRYSSSCPATAKHYMFRINSEKLKKKKDVTSKFQYQLSPHAYFKTKSRNLTSNLDECIDWGLGLTRTPDSVLLLNNQWTSTHAKVFIGFASQTRALILQMMQNSRLKDEEQMKLLIFNMRSLGINQENWGLTSMCTWTV